MKLGYKLNDKIDFSILVPVLLLMGIGLLAIYSATISQPASFVNYYKQIFWVGVSIIVLLVIYFLPPNLWNVFSTPVYFGSVFLLILVIFLGSTVYGAKSWILIGPVGFQPSEFAKIGTIIMLAHWLSNPRIDINKARGLIFVLGIGMLPIILILMEPDLGTAIVYSVILLIMIFWGGINLFQLFVVLSPAIVVFASMFGIVPFMIVIIGVIATLFYFKKNLFVSISVLVFNLSSSFIFNSAVKLLQPHQQKRIQTFIDPSSDPLGYGYNALQAKLAIGSGGLWGKGFLQGNQTQLKFIPKQWTDFIYCVIGEEFGFIGSMIVLALFFILFKRIIDLSSSAKNKFQSLVSVGVFALFFTHFSINVGMNVGLTPVIGVPLPFLSYGGSSLVANMILIGIILNIYRNRKMQ